MDLNLLKEGKIWCFQGKVFVTDPSGGNRHDAVFPLCGENCYFAKHLIPVPESGTVLDLCTGSGILAIFAAERARVKVIATDINPRALAFAQLNAGLNGVEDKIEFRQGDLWKPVGNEKFNLIISNPPFEPHNLRPLSKLLHSNGGIDGTEIVKKIINGVQNHLVINGSFQMIVGLLKNNIGILEDLKNGYFGKVTIKLVGKFGPIHYLFIEALNFKNEEVKRNE